MTSPDWKRPRRITGRTVAWRNAQVTEGDYFLKLRRRLEVTPHVARRGLLVSTQVRANPVLARHRRA